MSVLIVASIDEWIEEHVALGHDAVHTTVGAPGYGHGSYCWTCSEYGPSDVGILTLADVY